MTAYSGVYLRGDYISFVRIYSYVQFPPKILPAHTLHTLVRAFPSNQFPKNLIRIFSLDSTSYKLLNNQVKRMHNAALMICNNFVANFNVVVSVTVAGQILVHPNEFLFVHEHLCLKSHTRR